MEDNPQPPNEPASNRLAAFLRDCILNLIFLAMVAWLLYVGVTGVVTGHLNLVGSVRSQSWFFKPLNGFPAVLAGCSFLSLAAAFISIRTTQPRIAARVPSWVPGSYRWFVAGWAVLYFTARFTSGA